MDAPSLDGNWTDATIYPPGELQEPLVLRRPDQEMEACKCRTSAVQCSIGSTTGCTITEKAPTSAFTFKTLLRHYAKQVLTPRSPNVKLGPRHKSQKGWAVWLA